METVTWKLEHRSLLEGPARELGRSCGCASGIVVGTIAAAVLCLGIGLDWWWGVAAWLAAYGFGKLIGRVPAELRVEQMDFRPTGVLLTRADSVSAIELDAVAGIEVEHSGGPIEDRRTAVSLTYARGAGTVTVSVTNRYDPGLAEDLAAVLGSRVRLKETKPLE